MSVTVGYRGNSSICYVNLLQELTGHWGRRHLRFPLTPKLTVNRASAEGQQPIRADLVCIHFLLLSTQLHRGFLKQC